MALMKKRKYIRDAKGRFAEVAGNAPAPAKFFTEFSLDEQNLITKQLKTDRAKARREKAKLLAAANAGQTETVQKDPHSTVKPGAVWPKYPGLEEPAFKSKTPLQEAEEALAAAKASGDANAAKKARARVRREKAKEQAGNAGQKVTFPEDILAAPANMKKGIPEDAPTPPKRPKAAPPSAELVAEREKLKKQQARLAELNDKIGKGEAEMQKLATFAGGDWSPKKYQEIGAELRPAREEAKKLRVEIAEQKVKVRKLAAAEKPANTDTSEIGLLKADLAEKNLRFADLKTKERRLNELVEKTNGGYKTNPVTGKYEYNYAQEGNTQARKDLLATKKEREQLAQQVAAARLEVKKAELAKGDEKPLRKLKGTTPENREKVEAGQRKLQAAEVRVASADIAYREAQAKEKEVLNNYANYNYKVAQETRTRVRLAKEELDKARAQKVQAQEDIQIALGNLDPKDWMRESRIKTKVSAMNAEYEADDPAWRAKVGGKYGQTASGTLSPDKKKAHTDYTHSTYRYMNNALRTGTVESEAKTGSSLIDNYWGSRGGLPNLIQSMSDLINEDGHTLEHDTIVMRGVRGKADYKPGEIYAEGNIVEEKAFTSTTVSKSIQNSFAQKRSWKGDNDSWAIYVHLPAGTNYAHGNLSERELILDKGTKFRVLKQDASKNEIFLEKVVD